MTTTWQSLSGTSFANPELSKQGRQVNEKILTLLNVVDPAGDLFLGKKSGDTVAFRIYGRIAGESTTAIAEQDTIPFTDLPEFHGTGSVDRYGIAIRWTGEREDLDRLDTESPIVNALREHNGRVESKLIYNELVAGRSFGYVPLTATTADFQTDGTLGSAAAVPFTFWHAQNIAKNLIKNNTPFADGENYVCTSSTTMYFDMLMDREAQGFIDVKKYASGGAEGVLRNEKGMVGQLRLVLENHTLDDGIGTGSAFGSGFVTGAEAIKELPVYPMELRATMDLGGDFANQKAIAWQMLKGFKVAFNFSTHGQGSVLHYATSGL